MGLLPNATSVDSILVSKDNVLDGVKLFVVTEVQGLESVKIAVVLSNFVSVCYQDDAKLATIFLYPDQVPFNLFWIHAQDCQISLNLVLIWGVVFISGRCWG